MNLAKKLLIRLLVYFALVGYLALDLFVIDGPVKRMASGRNIDRTQQLADDRAAGVAARVYGYPIYQAQVRERMQSHLWQRGRTLEAVTSGERRLLHKLILSELIDEQLIKVQILVSDLDDFPVSKEWQDAALDRFQARPESDILIAEQGWEGEKELRLRLGARKQRADYLVHQLGPWIGRTPEDPRAWYDKFRTSLPGGDFEAWRPELESAIQARQRIKAMADFRRILRHKADGKISILAQSHSDV